MSGDPLGILTPKKSFASNDPLGILSTPKKEQPAMPSFMDIGGATKQTIQTAQQNIPKVQQQPQPKLQGGARDIMAGFGVRSDVTPNQEQQQYLQSSFEATQKLKEENKRVAVENTAALYFENNPIELKGIGLEKSGKKTGLAAAGKEPEKFSLEQLETASPFNKKVAELQGKLDRGEVTIYPANNGQLRLAYKADGLTNYIEGLKDAYYAKGKAEKILSMDFDEFKKFIEESKVDDKAYLPEKADQQSTLYGFGQASLMAGKGAAGAAIGSVLAAGAPTTGGLSTAGLPAVMAWAATVPDMATQMQAFSLVDYYNRAKQENPLISDKEAFEMAKNQSKAAYIEQLATGTVMVATGFASLPANTGQGLWKAVGQFAKNQPRALGETGLAVGAGSVARDMAARQFGFNVTDQEIYDNAYNQIRQEITEDLAFNIFIGAIHSPGYVKAQAKGVISKMPPEKVEQALQAAVQQGTITEEQAVKTAQGLAEFKAAESKVPETLPEEKRNAIAGLFEQRTKIEQEQKEALARLDPIFHDEVKEEYENQLSAINDKIKAIKDADDIFEFEQDNLTGQKANVLDEEQVVTATETPIENEIKETQVIQPKANEYKRLVEPEKSISEMNSEELYNLAIENRKALKKQDFQFKDKTEAEKEAEGYYNVIDDVEDLRDASERINFIENAENPDDIANSIKSIIPKIINNKPNEYQLAILNAAKRKTVELNINPQEVVKSILKKVASQYKDIEDAKAMVSKYFETLTEKPKADEGTITESESIERRLPESEREVEPITTETESIAETKPIESGEKSATKIETDKAVMDGIKTNSVENENGDNIALPEEGFLIDSVYLKEGQEKGKGSGQQLYQKALDENGVLYSHFPISEDALRVQDKLVEKGIAKIENITLSDGTELRKITKVSPTETKPIEPIQEPKAQPIGDENIVNYEDAIKITPTSELTNPEKYGTDELGMEAKTAALRDEEKTPPKFNKYEVGTYAKDKYGDLYQLQNVPIEKIVLPEGEQKRKETIDKYKKWYKEGNEFPPAKGVENYAVYKGKVVINDGHHRVVAAKQLGLKEVPVWVSLTDPKNPARPIQDVSYHKSLSTKAQPIEQTQQPTVSETKPIQEEVSITNEPETQPQEPIIAETQETTIKEQQGKVDTGAKKDLSTKAREYAAKLRSGEETVLPDWLQANLPKGTKKQGISINEAFAKALETFADIYDTTKNFAQAVDEGFQKIKDWFDENKIPYNEAELKEKFAQDRQGEIPTESQPPPPSEPPVSEQGEGKGGRTDERRFSKQMLETEDLVPEAKEGVKETLEYAVQTNAMSIQEASEILKKVGLDEGVALIMDRNNDMNGGVRVVMAQAIIKSYNELVKSATDDATKQMYLDKTIQVAKNVTEKLATDPGQMIQAFSLWKVLSPEAQLRDAVKDTETIGKARKEKQKKNINNIGNKFKKANEEAAEEVFNDPEVKNTINKNDSERAKKARVKIAKARQRRENILKKYKGQKGKNLFSTGVPGLSPEGIEFVGEVALTYIQEGIANVELLVEKIKQNLKEVSGKDVPDELTEQITQIADDKLNRSDERLIGKELKEQKLSINDIVKQHYTVAEKAKKSLADKLVEKAGLTGEEAADLAAKVEAAFDRIATRKKKRILFQEKARFDRIKNGMKGANTVDPKTLQGEMIRYSNLGAFENDAFADMIAEKLGTGKLTPQEAQKIIDLSEKVQNAPEGSPKNDATEDLLAYRANLKGTNWAEIAQGAWYANVLSGYKTHEKNIVSTFFNVVGELSAQSLKNPTEAPFILYGFLKGARRGGLEGIHTLVTGRSPIHVKKVETPNVLERKEFKGGYFNPANWLKFVTRAMVAEDVLMFQGLKEARAYQLALREAKKYGAKKGEIWKAVDELLLNTKQRYDEALAQAKSEGLASTIDIKRRVYELMEASRPVPMTEDTYGFAAEGTFNHETQGTLGAMSNAIAAFVDMPIGGAQPLRFIVPFTRIITNVVNQALNYTPVGLVRAARGVRGFRSFENYAYAKSAYVKLTPEQRKTIIAKASLGIGLAAALYALSKIKDEDDEPLIEITGGGTGDYKKDQQLREAGWQEYSIKVGDTYWSYKLTPLIFMLGFFGNMNDKEKYAKTEDDATTLKQMELAMWRNFNLVGELSWINTAGTLLGALQEGAKNKEDITRSLEQSMKGFLVPQAYTQAAQEVQKIFNMPQKRVENAWQNMIQDIPIARNSLNDKINVLGDPIIRDVDVINSEVTPDPVLKFLLDNNGWIAPVNKNSMIVYKNGIERDITEDEYYEFSKVRGQLVKQKIQKLMQSNLYKVDEFKVKTLSKGTPEYKRKLQSELSKIAQEATDEAKNKLMPKDLYIEITEEVSSSIENILNTR